MLHKATRHTLRDWGLGYENIFLGTCVERSGRSASTFLFGMILIKLLVLDLPVIWAAVILVQL